MSRPFFGKPYTFINPDGSEVETRGWGNQNYAVFETPAGYTVVRDPDTGYYCYATLSDDKSRLIATDARVGLIDPQSIAAPQHVRVRKESARAQARMAAMEIGPQRRWQVRRAQRSRQSMTPMGAAGQTAAPPPGATVGNYVGLCILIDFPDVTGTITQQQVEAFCNEQGYTGFGNNGSVRDYFHDVSDGKLTYTNLVTTYYTAANNRDYYTDVSIEHGIRARELIVEALDNLVAAGFDFSPLSSDSGGFVYALNVFHAGPVVNAWGEGLWPHAWSLLNGYLVDGGKTLFDYQITDMSAELTLATFCHENGHMICDFPDLYDYGGESTGPGDYCLMGHGGADKNPTQVGAYLKNSAGWTTSLTTITPGIIGTLTSGQNDFYIHRKNEQEYFILENRQQSGRDATLPDAGLAIWHVDENGSNNNEQMTAGMHYECSLEQADGDFDLEHGTNKGDSDDLFAAPFNTSFDDSTSPSTRWWDGSSSGLLVDHISESGPTMTFGSVPPANLDTRIFDLLLLDD